MEGQRLGAELKDSYQPIRTDKAPQEYVAKKGVICEPYVFQMERFWPAAKDRKELKFRPMIVRNLHIGNL